MTIYVVTAAPAAEAFSVTMGRRGGLLCGDGEGVGEDESEGE
jgi:hypothetical protein